MMKGSGRTKGEGREGEGYTEIETQSEEERVAHRKGRRGMKKGESDEMT